MREGQLASVVINNYNYGRFLGEAIESALAQSYQRLEVVVVDDGSTDESRQVIAEYGDRIRPVLKENGGQGSAINAGFAASRGEVVLFLDADDVLLPTAVERAVERLREPAVAKVHWPLWEMDAAGQRSGRLIPTQRLPDGDVRERIVREGPNACVTPPTSGNAWSRRLLERILPMPEAEFPINSDGYLVTLGWIYGPVAAIPEPQGLYRIHGANRFATIPAAEREERIYEMHLRRCDILEKHLEMMGVPTAVEAWKLRYARYKWSERLAEAKQKLGELVPPGGRFILVDDDALESDVARDRYAVPFLERDGHYWGRPQDDATAIQELERLRRTGAEYIVFVWFTFWWLDEYPGFADYLRERFPCVRVDNVLLAFDLR